MYTSATKKNIMNIFNREMILKFQDEVMLMRFQSWIIKKIYQNDDSLWLLLIVVSWIMTLKKCSKICLNESNLNNNKSWFIYPNLLRTDTEDGIGKYFRNRSDSRYFFYFNKNIKILFMILRLKLNKWYK